MRALKGARELLPPPPRNLKAEKAGQQQRVALLLLRVLRAAGRRARAGIFPEIIYLAD